MVLFGYVFHNYLVEVPDRKIEQIRLSIDNPVINKGETKKLKVEILPEDVKDHKIEFTSSDIRVATVDSSGNVLGISSGNAKIRAKAVENNVFSEIDIQVYSPVTDIVLNKENLILQTEDKFKINPIVLPEDASNKNIKYKSDNDDIATVSSDGIVQAVDIGDTKIIVQSDDESITKEIQVKVVQRLTEDEISFDEPLRVEQNEISGWDINNLTVGKVKEMIHTKYKLEIYNYKDEPLDDEKLIGTGSKIRIVDENNIIKMEYEVVIYGDLTGDGKINTIDLLVLQRHVLEIEMLNGAFLKAGNINKNGKNPSTIDLLIIQRHILELELIKQ